MDFQRARKKCDCNRNMNILFTSGGNWYTTIIGHKAVRLWVRIHLMELWDVLVQHSASYPEEYKYPSFQFAKYDMNGLRLLQKI